MEGRMFTETVFSPVRSLLHASDAFFGIALIWLHYGFRMSIADMMLLCLAVVCIHAGSRALRYLTIWQDQRTGMDADAGISRRMTDIYCLSAACFAGGLVLAMNRGMQPLCVAAILAGLSLIRGAFGSRWPVLDATLFGIIRVVNVFLGMSVYPAPWGILDDTLLLVPVGIVGGYALLTGLVSACEGERLRDTLTLGGFLAMAGAAWATLYPEYSWRGAAVLPYVGIVMLGGMLTLMNSGYHVIFRRAAWCSGVFLQGALLLYFIRQDDGMRILLPLAVFLVPAISALIPDRESSQRGPSAMGAA